MEYKQLRTLFLSFPGEPSSASICARIVIIVVGLVDGNVATLRRLQR